MWACYHIRPISKTFMLLHSHCSVFFIKLKNLLSMKERIFYIDYAKAVGMLMIIAAHTYMWTPATESLCYIAGSFHVPIFFFISGLLLALFPREESFKVFIKKRSTALLIPYVCFSLFNAIQTLSVLKFQHNLTDERLHSELIELLITGNGTVWFLLTLFLAELSFYLFRMTKSNTAIIGSAIILGLLPYIPWGQNNPFMIVVNRAMSAYGFLVFGYYMKSILMLSKKTRFICGGTLIIIWIIMIRFFPYSYSAFSGIFESPVNSIITITAASMGCILLLSCIDLRLPLLEHIGKNSLLFMLCHPTFIKIYIVLGVSHMRTLSPFMQILGSTIVFIVVLVSAAMFGEIIKRWFPFTIGKKYKSFK